MARKVHFTTKEDIITIIVVIILLLTPAFTVMIAIGLAVQ